MSTNDQEFQEGSKIRASGKLNDVFLGWVESLEKAEPGEMWQASNAFFDFLLRDRSFTNDDSRCSSGTILSPMDAARCLVDLLRTKAFALGVRAAIEEKLSQGVETVRVLYSGCGPFATLALPQFSKFPREKTQWTLLDYHQTCLDSASKLISSLGFSGHVESLIQADATDYELQPGYEPHILVVECLQRALMKECQVAIVSNLVNQLPMDTILIPESIELTGHWLDAGREVTPIEGDPNSIMEARRDRIDLGKLFTLDSTSVRQWGPLGDRQSLPCSPVSSTPSPKPGQGLHILTNIKVFDEHSLAPYDSGLTVPLGVDVVPSEDGTFKFEYRLGANPGPFPARDVPS